MTFSHLHLAPTIRTLKPHHYKITLSPSQKLYFWDFKWVSQNVDCSRHRSYGNFLFESEITHKFSEEVSAFVFKWNGEAIFLSSTVPETHKGHTPLDIQWIMEAGASGYNRQCVSRPRPLYADFKNEWSWTSTSSYAFTARALKVCWSQATKSLDML